MDNDVRELRNALREEGEVNVALVCDAFEAAELVQQQTTHTSEELWRIAGPRSRTHDRGEALMSAEGIGGLSTCARS